jgi:hypothetical protein
MPGLVSWVFAEVVESCIDGGVVVEVKTFSHDTISVF